jgi:hypothetical protein
MAEVMMFYRKSPFWTPVKTEPIEVQVSSSSRFQPNRAPLKLRAAKNERYRQDAFPEDFSFAVNVLQKQLECLYPLLESSGN